MFKIILCCLGGMVIGVGVGAVIASFNDYLSSAALATIYTHMVIAFAFVGLWLGVVILKSGHEGEEEGQH